MEANDGYTYCLIGSKISKDKLKCQRKKNRNKLDKQTAKVISNSGS